MLLILFNSFFERKVKVSYFALKLAPNSSLTRTKLSYSPSPKNIFMPYKINNSYIQIYKKVPSLILLIIR